MNRYLIEEIDLRHAYQLMCVCSVDDGHEAWLKKIQGHMEEVNQILQDNCVICCLEQLDTVKQADPKKRVMLASDSVYNSIYESLYTTSDHKDETDIELDDVSDNEVQSFDNSSMSTASDIELDDVQSNDQVKLSNIPQIIERWDDQGWNTWFYLLAHFQIKVSYSSDLELTRLMNKAGGLLSIALMRSGYDSSAVYSNV